MAGVEFVKGHGTENDFVVLPDPAGTLALTEARVRALCDRSRGLGADGVLRVVPTRAVVDAPAGVDDSLWFMDYRNADGSVAEMCGNGVRVFARYLVETGLASEGRFTIGTRAGERGVTVHPDRTVTVDMGPARVVGRSAATVDGTAFPGVAVDVGNPHLVCRTDTPVDDLDLTRPPGHDPVVFPHGVNVEFVNVLGEDALRMRVHERGVGETRSCGTGTVATVAAWLHLAGRTSGRATVAVPGGQVTVTVDERGSTLTGPAVLVAGGELDEQWWADNGF
ncbi:diaminopimelate epimerase [Goodfellowiella coeruleoviolacea]|uniref:Diaminopimelate epimerase n=1 Tax=Goodfellowiella coeruleoviolacea TaxID=334858 RepID=A0AAE3GMJ5_9PSEU|nr:diaminopimelate epimerase [Goodfellowiella coeruleoviolacea]MCP2170283.1 diaminopimelate epimerase [Goodfellowiella coeruleoviolacea]